MEHKQVVEQEKNGVFTVTASTTPYACNETDAQNASESTPLVLTLLIIAINVAVWLIQLMNGVDLFEPSPEDLLKWGGNLSVFTFTGDYWRLLSNMFLHGGAVHLLMNMYMLLLIGPHAERWFRRSGFIGIYLAGGLWASYITAVRGAFAAQNRSSFSAASYSLFGARPVELVVSIGASGALMAVCGALLAGAFVRMAAGHGSSSDETNFRNGLLQVIGLNLVSGFFISGIDQAAHVGGAVAGLILGAAFGIRENNPNARRHMLRMALVTLCACGTLIMLLRTGEWTGMQELRDELNYSSKPAAASWQEE